MAQIIYNGDTLVSGSQSNTTEFGEFRFTPGGLEAERFTFGFPRADNVMVVEAGKRLRTHRAEVRWITENPDTLESQIRALELDTVYGTLQVIRNDSNVTYLSCYLADVAWGERLGGQKPNGQDCAVMHAVLTFVQVKVR
jgi:hypothetical protein